MGLRLVRNLPTIRVKDRIRLNGAIRKRVNIRFY